MPTLTSFPLPKPDLHELKLSVAGVRRNPDFEMSHMQATPQAVKMFGKDPLHAPMLAWRYGARKTGISPFVLAYLTGESPTAIHQKLKSLPKQFRYTYCWATRLPVSYSNIKLYWNNTFDVEGYYGENRWGREDRDQAFDRLLVGWNAQAARPEGITDEYVRRFGGHPISKKVWNHMKAMIDAFKP